MEQKGFHQRTFSDHYEPSGKMISSQSPISHVPKKVYCLQDLLEERSKRQSSLEKNNSIPISPKQSQTTVISPCGKAWPANCVSKLMEVENKWQQIKPQLGGRVSNNSSMLISKTYTTVGNSDKKTLTSSKSRMQSGTAEPLFIVSKQNGSPTSGTKNKEESVFELLSDEEEKNNEEIQINKIRAFEGLEASKIPLRFSKPEKNREDVDDSFENISNENTVKKHICASPDPLFTLEGKIAMPNLTSEGAVNSRKTFIPNIKTPTNQQNSINLMKTVAISCRGSIWDTQLKNTELFNNTVKLKENPYELENIEKHENSENLKDAIVSMGRQRSMSRWETNSKTKFLLKTTQDNIPKSTVENEKEVKIIERKKDKKRDSKHNFDIKKDEKSQKENNKKMILSKSPEPANSKSRAEKRNNIQKHMKNIQPLVSARNTKKSEQDTIMRNSFGNLLKTQRITTNQQKSRKSLGYQQNMGTEIEKSHKSASNSIMEIVENTEIKIPSIKKCANEIEDILEESEELEEGTDDFQLFAPEDILKDASNIKKQLKKQFKVNDINSAFNKLYEAAVMRQVASAQFEKAKSEIMSQLRRKRIKKENNENRRSAEKFRVLESRNKITAEAYNSRPESCSKLRNGETKYSKNTNHHSSIKENCTNTGKRSISTMKK